MAVLTFCSSSSILVNSKSRIIRLQFAKVFWDYASEGGQAGAAETPAAPLGESSSHLGTLESPRRATDERNVEKSGGFQRRRVPPPSTKQQVQGKVVVSGRRAGFKEPLFDLKLSS